jgi:putative transposase
MEKFKNKYRTRSKRMPNWDYSTNGFYFITIVTQNRECNLGRIINCEMVFSDFGKIVNDEWIKSFQIRNELFLDEYIIMPNHLHAILVLNANQIVETHGHASLQQSNLVRKPKSISSFIAGFKSAINSKIDDYIDKYNLNIPKYNRNNHFFQPNYYDRIIRNDPEYWQIKKYIINNPATWSDDKLNTIAGYHV